MSRVFDLGEIFKIDLCEYEGQQEIRIFVSLGSWFIDPILCAFCVELILCR